jgi:uncharacterized protein YbjQ (UPF0145 family)
MKSMFFAVAVGLSFAAPPAFAADDDVGAYQLASVLERPDYMSQLEGVTFHFGSSPAVSRTIEQDATTSQRTRKFGRSAEEACQWVLLSALIRLRDHAIALGGNAVVNIESNWQNVPSSSTTEYQCAVGGLMAGVALKADIATIN